MATIPDDGRALGAWLAEQREASGLTQAELAQAAGVATRTIQRWEAGAHAPVDVIRVLTALGVRMDPREPEQVRALNSAVGDVAKLLGGLDDLMAQTVAREDAGIAGRLEALTDAVGDLVQKTAEAFERVEGAIAQLAAARQPPAAPARRR